MNHAETKSVLTQKLTNMSTHDQHVQVTCRFDSNQDPKKCRIGISTPDSEYSAVLHKKQLKV